MSVLDGECLNVSYYPSLKGLCVRKLLTWQGWLRVVGRIEFWRLFKRLSVSFPVGVNVWRPGHELKRVGNLNCDGRYSRWLQNCKTWTCGCLAVSRHLLV